MGILTQMFKDGLPVPPGLKMVGIVGDDSFMKYAIVDGEYPDETCTPFEDDDGELKAFGSDEKDYQIWVISITEQAALKVLPIHLWM